MPKRYVDMGLKFKDEDVEIMAQVQAHKWRVICDGVVYETIKECADFYGMRQNRMSRWLTGVRAMPKKFKDMGLDYWNGGDVE